MIVFGLALLLFQYRFHPFGFWGLIIGAIIIVERLRRQFDWSRLATTAICLAVIAVALQPPLKKQLFGRVPPGLNRDYAAGRTMLPVLSEACAKRTGTVLSYSNDGHPIRYHTDCSVVTNNLLITPFHRQKVIESRRYLDMNAQDFIKYASHIDYLFVRMTHAFEIGGDFRGVTLVDVEDVKEANAPLFVELTFSDEIPAEYRLLGELRVEDERDFAFVRVFEIVRN